MPCVRATRNLRINRTGGMPAAPNITAFLICRKLQLMSSRESSALEPLNELLRRKIASKPDLQQRETAAEFRPQLTCLFASARVLANVSRFLCHQSPRLKTTALTQPPDTECSG